MDYYKKSLQLHKKLGGKIHCGLNIDPTNSDDLSTVYSPGVAAPCLAIHENPSTVYDYTIKKNTVAIVSDGSAVLGLGNIGAEASIPVMEGKAMLFKKFANVDAFPICIKSQSAQAIIETVRNIAPVFGGINLEDIGAPKCFEIELALQDLGIPVFHDDQHGTAVVTLAAMINASKVTKKPLSEMRVVMNGAGAAGVAIAKMLMGVGFENVPNKVVMKDLILCDTSGIISTSRKNLNEEKKRLLTFSNKEDISGSLRDALVGADVFIGVSKGNLLTKEDIKTMAPNSIIFAMANPTPEIMPSEAIKGGALVVGTGRSDLPNQVNNVLGFPGIFRGALDVRAPRIYPEMLIAAAYAIASCVKKPVSECVIPSAFDISVAPKVAKAVAEAYKLRISQQ
jgi:malate dehydrogenase (oxaloacetate-decarboxylating)